MADHAPNLEWEDWDPSKGTFVHHMLAGSMAGITEHTVMFPVDTIKTHVQCIRDCPERQAGLRVLEMVKGEGMLRLWRGVGTMFMGCVPAHALYFGVLENCKEKFGANKEGHQPIGAAAAGAFATIFHDSIMTPMDVIKQRLQLGYYSGITDCIRSVYRNEGASAFYRSFPTTLFMNIPYGAVMVAANESIKKLLRPEGDNDTTTFLLAGSGAGAIAAMVTTPLDVVKTRLQIQELHARVASSATSSRLTSTGSAKVPFAQVRAPRPHNVTPAPAASHNNAAMEAAVKCGGCREAPVVPLQYQGLVDAVRQIKHTEGVRGFFRGAGPRMLVHTPSVAISWTTYETCKRWLNEAMPTE